MASSPKSAMQRASTKKGTAKKVALEEARRALLGDRADPDKVAAAAGRAARASRMKAQGMSEARTMVTINGVQRAIRLDTNESEADRLNELVRDVRQTELNARNHELSRRAKMTGMAKEVDRLQMQRVQYNLEVTNWEPHTWRAINTLKSRQTPSDLLHYVAPERRRQHLHAIEGAANHIITKREVARTNRRIAAINAEKALAAAATAAPGVVVPGMTMLPATSGSLGTAVASAGTAATASAALGLPAGIAALDESWGSREPLSARSVPPRSTATSVQASAPVQVAASPSSARGHAGPR